MLPYTNIVSDDTNKFANDLDFKEIEAELKEMNTFMKQKSSKKTKHL